MKGIRMAKIRSETETDSKPYEELANAIVLQAIEDFRFAVATEKIYEDKLQRNEISDNGAIPVIRAARSEQRIIRQFFKSAWCDWLTEMDCSHLADKMKQDTLEFLRLGESAMAAPKAKSMTKAKWDENSEENAELFQNQFQCPTCGGKVGMTYGFVGSTGKRDKRMDKYGWRIQCEGCKFTLKFEKERIKPLKKKGEENEKNNNLLDD